MQGEAVVRSKWGKRQNSTGQARQARGKGWPGTVLVRGERTGRRAFRNVRGSVEGGGSRIYLHFWMVEGGAPEGGQELRYLYGR